MATTKQNQIIAGSIANRAAQATLNILSAIICTFTVSATTEKFVAKDKFKVDTSRKAKVKIALLGDNFKSWFLGKIEDPHPGSTVGGRKMEKNSVDCPILAELGGNEKAETSLTEIFQMMEAQPNGEDGDLFNNGWANIFYVPDIHGTLRAVVVNWGGDGWDVVACSGGDPGEWGAGHCVFFRNSLGA